MTDHLDRHASPGPVLVVGDVMVDVVATHRDAIAIGSDTPASVRLHGGGSAANTAAWLASLGDEARLFAAVGDDGLGDRAVAELEAAGVAFLGPVLAGRTTGACVVLVGPDGDRTMLPDRGANDDLPAAAVAAAFTAPSPAWVHVSGYALLGEGSRPAGRAALAAALAAGCAVSVDAASAAPLRAVGAEAFLEWIQGATVVLANDDEAEALGGTPAVLDAVASVVVKHGAAGATWTDGARSLHADGVPVGLVDPTGAGDAFAAGWIVARRTGAGVDASLARAVGCGAAAVALPGARPGPGPDARPPVGGAPR